MLRIDPFSSRGRSVPREPRPFSFSFFLEDPPPIFQSFRRTDTKFPSDQIQSFLNSPVAPIPFWGREVSFFLVRCKRKSKPELVFPSPGMLAGSFRGLIPPAWVSFSRRKIDGPSGRIVMICFLLNPRMDPSSFFFFPPTFVLYPPSSRLSSGYVFLLFPEFLGEKPSPPLQTPQCGCFFPPFS